MKAYNLLFICQHNVFRSKVAEAYFNQIKDKEPINCASGGLFAHHCLSEEQNKIAEEEGIYITGEPRNLTTSDLSKQDLIVIVSKEIPMSVISSQIYKKEILKWETPDIYEYENRCLGTREIIMIIKSKVDTLYKEIISASDKEVRN